MRSSKAKVAHGLLVLGRLESNKTNMEWLMFGALLPTSFEANEQAEERKCCAVAGQFYMWLCTQCEEDTMHVT